MSWWFSDTFFNTKEDVGRLINIFRTKLPEALPKRYGLYEPPQHKLAETSIEHFTDFVWDNLGDIIVWYPNRPVINVHIGYSKDRINKRLGFRSNYLEIEIEQSVLLQKGWAKSLKDLWQEISLLINPFYGDVRTIKGNLWTGARSASDIDTEFHPIRAGFWRGVPLTLGQSVVLGEPYNDKWPEFIKKAKKSEGIYFLDTENWIDEKEIADDIIKIPREISHKHIPKWTKGIHCGYSQNWNEEYPQIWPFDKPEDIISDNQNEIVKNKEWWKFWKR
jgi:hypothetical protein